LFEGDAVVAATLVAVEGALPDDSIEAVAQGQRRLRGHALAETLIAHSASPELASLRLIRSVRIVVHPRRRRLGYGSALIEAVHEHHRADLFGTLFGAEPELLRFRRQSGYRLIRLGASRSARSGEPSVVMLRPVSEVAELAVQNLQRRFARELPLTLRLREVDDGHALQGALRRALSVDLLPADTLSDEARVEQLDGYLFAGRSYETAALALRKTLQVWEGALPALLRERVLEERSWLALAQRHGFETVAGVMRAHRRALRELFER